MEIIMRKTSLQIKMLYEKMGSAEKKIADWIIENPDALVPLSISELADSCGCSEATVVRFARRLGFNGYQELKISLAQESGKTQLNDAVSESDSCFEIFEKVSNDIYCTLEMTKNSIDKTALEQAAELVLNARKTVVFGLGNSASVATDMQHKFLRIGHDVTAYCDNHMQVIAASHLCENDLAIGISHSGSSVDIVDALKIAKQSGAKTIAVTNKGKSPIIKHGDIVLYTNSDETQYSILGLNSRIAQLAIVNALYYYVACHDKTVKNAIELTERSLQSKKY